MRPSFDTFCQLGAALLIGAAGIFGLIESTTMIVLITVVICLRNKRACPPAPRAA